MIQPHQESVGVINLTKHEKKKSRSEYLWKKVWEKSWSNSCKNTWMCLRGHTKLVKLLQQYVDTNIVEHKLPFKRECTPIKQTLRRTRHDMSLKIREEVKKQFNVDFLALAKYPQWVTNIVSVQKKDGKVRMCVDYCDLNKVSPNDDFPLSH